MSCNCNKRRVIYRNIFIFEFFLTPFETTGSHKNITRYIKTVIQLRHINLLSIIKPWSLELITRIRRIYVEPVLVRMNVVSFLKFHISIFRCNQITTISSFLRFNIRPVIYRQFKFSIF